MSTSSISGESLFDEFFNDFSFYDDKEERRLEKKLHGRRAQDPIKTDIKEMDQGYEMEIGLPGLKREDTQALIQNGYLTISATKGLEKEGKGNDNGHYIRRERHADTCERSLCVGEYVTQEDIKTELKHGTPKLFVPRKETVSAAEESKYISTEG